MFAACFANILGVRKVRTILDVFKVFPWFFKKTKEKKDREILTGDSSPAILEVCNS